MFLGSVHNRTHTFGYAQVLNLKVKPHAAVALLAHRLALLIITIDPVVERPIIRSHLRSSAAQSLRADRIPGAIHERVFPMARVIDGNMPIDRISAHGVTA